MGVKIFGQVKEKRLRRLWKKADRKNRCPACGLPQNNHDHLGCQEEVKRLSGHNKNGYSGQV